MGSCLSISKIKPQNLLRISTKKDEIDWLYGFTKWPDGRYGWGLPCGKVSLWSGEKGVGKTRAITEIAKSISFVTDCKNRRYPVIYFSLEEEMNVFAKSIQKDGVVLPPTFYISDERSLQKQIEFIRKNQAMIIFVDSVNQLDEYKSYSDNKIREIVETYRKIAVERNGHVILISMLNKKGDIKGSTTLPYLVDIEFSVSFSERVLAEYGDGYFEVAVGKKHRAGRTGEKFYSVWKHYTEKSDIISQNRMKDTIWPPSHGQKIIRRTLTEVMKEISRDPKKMKEEGLPAKISKMLEKGEIELDEPVIEPYTFGDKILDGFKSIFR